MGTPEFSVAFLEALIKSEHNVVAVVTQPDRQAGRGRKITPPPVKVAAEKNGIPLFQPENLKDENFINELKVFDADLSVVVAFSILPKKVLEATKLGALNMHGSLLPKYRGAAPIQWAIAKGDKKTGATIFLLDEKMDHGPILKQVELDIEIEDTAADIFKKMVPLGVKAVLDTVDELNKIPTDKIVSVLQDDSLASPAPKLTKSSGLIDFDKDALSIYNSFRGFYPWPGAWSYLEKKTMSIHKFILTDKKAPDVFLNGALWIEDKEKLFVKCNGGSLEIKELQMEGKKRVNAEDFIRGLQKNEGLLLTRTKA